MEEAKKEEIVNKRAAKGDMTEGSVGKKLVAFAIPLAIASLVQALYNLADMSIVGHFVGSAGMSAVTMGGLIINVVFAVINGLSNGGAIFMGQLYGARKQDQIKNVIGTMLTGYAILAVIVTGLIIGFERLIFTAMKAPAESKEMAVTYLAIYMAGTIFVYIYNVLAASLRAVGKTTPAMVAVVVTAALNVVLDLLFVGPLKMGVAGAALATIISQCISMIIIAVYVKKTGLFDFRIKSFGIDWKLFKTVFKIGLPQACQFGLTVMSYLLISGFVNQYGVFASAASGATSKIWSFEVLPAQSVQMAVMTLTAQNIARGKIDRIKKGLLIAMAIAFVSAGLFWGASQLFPEAMLGIFTSDQGVIDIGTRYLQILLGSGIFESLMFCLFGVIAGSGNTLYNFLCAVLSAIVVRFSLVWIFDHFTTLGFNGIAWAYVCAPIASGLAALIFVLSGKWKTSKIRL
ncbi:MAG: MATE family efflux transporter [Lachnospiraceae bacterium]|nr:MATE family efflux transporter [Lachnospiraceae bacterium]